MNFLLYIQASSQNEFNYNNPTLKEIKDEFSSFTVVDIDNESGSDLISYCVEAAKSSPEVIIVFDGTNQMDISRLGPIIRCFDELSLLKCCNLTQHQQWDRFCQNSKALLFKTIASLKEA